MPLVFIYNSFIMYNNTVESKVLIRNANSSDNQSMPTRPCIVQILERTSYIHKQTHYPGNCYNYWLPWSTPIGRLSYRSVTSYPQPTLTQIIGDGHTARNLIALTITELDTAHTGPPHAHPRVDTKLIADQSMTSDVYTTAHTHEQVHNFWLRTHSNEVARTDQPRINPWSISLNAHCRILSHWLLGICSCPYACP